ncbi:hypothetical protein [Nitriliruptor alkaliphilus]|uniref:hypothetical protein n=1 Tax=Nitriliruptor alkaliphilus TaxID=427918 RepID=UPI000696E58F|nr:hypothetical protein [Nitriliruptor alkaliphilus]
MTRQLRARWHDQRAAASAEYIAVLVLVASLIASVTSLTPLLAEQLRSEADRAFCQIAVTTSGPDAVDGGCETVLAGAEGPTSSRTALDGDPDGDFGDGLEDGQAGVPGEHGADGDDEMVPFWLRDDRPLAGASPAGDERSTARRLGEGIGGFLSQVGGVASGAARQVGQIAGGMVEGGRWVTDSFLVPKHDTWVDNLEMGRAVRDNPRGALRSIWDGMTEPIRSDWNDGHYGSAVGRAGVEVGSVFVGGGAVRAGLQRLRNLDRAADTLRAADRAADARHSVNAGRARHALLVRQLPPGTSLHTMRRAIVDALPAREDLAAGLRRTLADERGSAALGGRGSGPTVSESVERFLTDVRAGNAFNAKQANAYPYREVTVESVRRGRDGLPRRSADGTIQTRRTRVDSLDQNREIVERKYTQLHRVREETAARYIRETATKYPEGAIIRGGNGRNAPLNGQELAGQHVLVVPAQSGPLPQKARKAASDYDVIIRDVDGTILFDPTR